MATATNDHVTFSSRATQAGISGRRFGPHVIFQCGLVLVVFGLFWLYLGPPPQSVMIYWAELALIVTSGLIVTVAWLMTTSISVERKLFAFVIVQSVILGVAIDSASQFELAYRVLEPARVVEGRVVHTALGLSYRVPAGCRVNLQPLITLGKRTLNDRSGSKLRLAENEMAVVSRLVLAHPANGNTHAPATIVLEIQRGPIAGLNELLLIALKNETKWAADSSHVITQPSHLARIGGRDAIEFEVVENPQRLFSRQIFLTNGQFILNFMLNSEDEADRPAFEQFLETIRLQHADWFRKFGLR